MLGLKQGIRSMGKNQNISSSSSSNGSSSISGSDFSSEQSQIIIRRSSSKMISVWTCSKICAIGFVVGVIVGFTLKRRVRRWASKLLKRLKDD